ncbi:MAG: hypothetical protein GXP01_02825 [Alphaproteobacteria bacterium]|nr:hypothetical protein [Alphaproteobacteria bacterium]
MPEIFKISALLTGSALLMFAGGLQGLLLSLRGGEEGFSLTALGLIGTGWSVGFIAGPVLAALAMSVFTPASLFGVTALFHLALALDPRANDRDDETFDRTE